MINKRKKILAGITAFNQITIICFIKVKYNDFKLVSSQKSYDKLHYDIFYDLLLKIYKTNAKPIRLLGAGIQFNNSETSQLNLDII